MSSSVITQQSSGLATETQSGLVSTGTQSFGGDKTFAGTKVVVNGNVGIGTSSPGAKMHLSSGDASYAWYGPNTTWGGFLIVGACQNQVTTLKAQVISTDGNIHLDSATSKSAYINYYSQGNTYINAQAGNVGIGTTTPSYKLHVNGSGFFSSNVLCFRGEFSSGDANYLNGLDGFYGSGSDGYYRMVRPGYSSAFWQHGHGGSTGTIQWATSYGSALYRRNRTDDATWTAWRQVD